VIKSIGNILLVLLLIGAGIYGVFLFLQETNLAAPALFKPLTGGVRLLMKMDGFRIAQSEGGRVSWRMHAQSAELLENKEARLQDVAIDFTNPENKEATLTGDLGTMDTVTGNGSLRRNTRDVRIVTSDGYVLTSRSLLWKAGDRTVWTADPFKLLGSEIYLEGTGIVANLDKGSLVVKNNVKGVLQE
jgi:LPS export ABC transporter protein LptC